MKIEYRIMAVRERQRFVDALVAKLGLPESAVFWDDDRIGCIENALRAWGAPCSKDTTHIIVLQDDIEVVDDFKEITKECAESFPDAIFGFFHYVLRKEDKIINSPYILMPNCNVKGECMMIPVKHIPGYIAFYNEHLRSLKYPHDDATCRMYALLNDIKVFSTIPGLVKNLCPTGSVMGHNDADHYSRVWEGEKVDAKQFKTREYQIAKFFPIFTHLPKNDPLNIAVKTKIARNKEKFKAVYGL